MATEGKIALFVGNDVVAHLVMNKVVDYLVGEGYEPMIFFPKTPEPSKKKTNPLDEPEMKNFTFFESKLIHDALYPFLAKNPMAKAPNVTPEQLVKRFPDANISLRHIDNVNDPAFVAELESDPEIIGGLSIRCKQKFRKPIIDLFNKFNNEDGFLINLHPGYLPHYRGLMSTARAFYNAARAEAGNIKVPREKMSYGWTLHHVGEEFDTGDVLQVGLLQIPKPPSITTIWQANINAVDSAIKIVKRTMDDLLDVGRLNGYPQVIRKDEHGKDVDYYTFPTREELDQWNKSIALFNREETVMTLVQAFSEPGTKHQRCLERHLKGAIEEWEKETPMHTNGLAPGEGFASQNEASQPSSYHSFGPSFPSRRAALA